VALFSIFSAALCGLLLGLRYTVGALLFVCGAVTLVLFMYGFWAAWSFWNTFVAAAVLLSIMEAFYLLGAVVRGASIKDKSEQSNSD
jgi:hypothetical protein